MKVVRDAFTVSFSSLVGVGWKPTTWNVQREGGTQSQRPAWVEHRGSECRTAENGECLAGDNKLTDTRLNLWAGQLAPLRGTLSMSSSLTQQQPRPALVRYCSAFSTRSDAGSPEPRKKHPCSRHPLASPGQTCAFISAGQHRGSRSQRRWGAEQPATAPRRSMMV